MRIATANTRGVFERPPGFVFAYGRTNSCLRALSLCTCRRYYPVQRLGVVFAHLTQPYQPSPKGSSGQPEHRPFRGLHGVHLRCGPHTRAVTYT
jgi:hypothetical protein